MRRFPSLLVSLAALSAVLLLVPGCGAKQERPTARAAASAPPPSQPAAADTAATSKPVEVSPAVKALLAEDPDLKTSISKDEVRATLEAARSGAETADAGEEEATTGSGEWGKLEKDQKTKNAERRAKLDATVYTGADGYYHSAGCDKLYDYVMTKDSGLQRVYSGSAVSLSWALDRGLRRHPECKAPAQPQ